MLPFMAGEDLYYMRADSRGAGIGGAHLCRRPHCLFRGAHLELSN